MISQCSVEIQYTNNNKTSKANKDSTKSTIPSLTQSNPIMEREEDTGISILVVGGGIAGLTFAIEAHRKGHNVQIVERRLRGETAGKNSLSLLCIFIKISVLYITLHLVGH